MAYLIKVNNKNLEEILGLARFVNGGEDNINVEKSHDLYVISCQYGLVGFLKKNEEKGIFEFSKPIFYLPKRHFIPTGEKTYINGVVAEYFYRVIQKWLIERKQSEIGSK